MSLSIIALLAIVALGYFAQRAGICLVKATKQLLQGRPGFLLSIAMSGVWVWCYVIYASYTGVEIKGFDSYAFHPLFAIGGFIFGVGASINQGCNISTLNSFARGHVSMGFAIIGWFVGWCIWAYINAATGIEYAYEQQSGLSVYAMAMIALPIVVTVLYLTAFTPSQRSRLLGILVVGFLGGILFLIRPDWPPSNVIRDAGTSLLFDAGFNASTWNVVLFVGLFVGMWLSVAITRETTLRKPTWHKFVRHSIAGTMMGLGSAMALGGNDAALLVGIPSTSTGAIVALIFMIVGISVEQFFYHRGKLFYQKR